MRSRVLPKTTEADILSALSEALTRYPTWPTDPLHAVSLVVEEVGETVQAVLNAVFHHGDVSNVRKEMIHTAVTALRFLACENQYVYKGSEQK